MFSQYKVTEAPGSAQDRRARKHILLAIIRHTELNRCMSFPPRFRQGSVLLHSNQLSKPREGEGPFTVADQLQAALSSPARRESRSQSIIQWIGEEALFI
jgi:hypothetical protein